MRFIQRSSTLCIAALLIACSSSMSIDRTYEDAAYVDQTYSNVLVLAVAADYNARSRFERSLATSLRSGNTVATEYYEIADGDQEVTREKILAAIERYGYDGVIVSQLGSQQSEISIKTPTSKAKVSRRDDRAVDFFRYDYEILNEPHVINVEMQVVIVTDFFNGEDAKRIWSSDATVMDKENISYLVEDATEMIAARLRRDGLVSD
ncbi:MAG: hypothetical protein ACR2QR_00785 [Woeseiaceae bacterium]